MRRWMPLALLFLLCLHGVSGAQEQRTVMTYITGSEAALRIFSGITIDTPESERLRWGAENKAPARWADTFAPMYAKAAALAAHDPNLLAAVNAHQAKARQCLTILDWTAEQDHATLRAESIRCRNDLIERRAMIEVELEGYPDQ